MKTSLMKLIWSSLKIMTTVVLHYSEFNSLWKLKIWRKCLDFIICTVAKCIFDAMVESAHSVTRIAVFYISGFQNSPPCISLIFYGSSGPFPPLLSFLSFPSHSGISTKHGGILVLAQMQGIQQLQSSHDLLDTLWVTLIVASEVSSLRRATLVYLPRLFKMLMGFKELN